MTETEPTVFVVDDDEAVCRMLQRLIEAGGLRVETYTGAQEFLDAYDRSRPGCLVLDMYMPRMSGLKLQEKLAAQQIDLPVIIITGHGDVAKAVWAIKAGALDFIEKPFQADVLLDRVKQAIELDAENRRRRVSRAETAARVASLTPRERKVMDLMVAGDSNEQIALELGISKKTVEIHRARVMQKMKADSLADLICMALKHVNYQDAT